MEPRAVCHQHQCPDPSSSIRPRRPCLGRGQGCTYSVCPRQKASMLCGAAAQLTRIFSSRSAVSTNWSSGLTAYIARGNRKRATHWLSTNWSSGLMAYIARSHRKTVTYWGALQIPSECLDLLQSTLKAFQGAEVQLGRAQRTGRHRGACPAVGGSSEAPSSHSSA